MVAPATPGQVRRVVEPAVASLGLVLEGVEVTRSGTTSVVRLVVDLAPDDHGDLDLDRVAEATRAASAALDAEDVVPGHYTLEVSSPGVDRPLTARRHYVRALRRTVRLTLDDGSVVTGRLAGVEGDDDEPVAVVVPSRSPGRGRRPVDEPPVRVALARVTHGKVVVDLSGLGPVDEHDDEQHDEHDEHDEHGDEEEG